MKLSKKLQKLFAMLLVAVMVVSVLPMGSLSVFAATGEFAGGDGTEGNPYLIANKEQLNNVRNYLSASFKLIADIEFDDSDFQYGGDFYNNGAGFEPIGSLTSVFNGTFDGDGHVIKNLYINIESDTDVYVGLFGYNDGTIKNIGMVDGNITAITTANHCHAYTGGIAGRTYSGTITNCYNTGNVSASSSSSAHAYAYVGGIAGYNGYGTIENSDNTGTVAADASGSNSYAHAGGIAGYSYNVTIRNCYNTGDVSADSSSYAYAGGVAGSNYYETITNCYNTGDVSATCSVGSSYAHAGGIAGINDKTITNCYNTGEVLADADDVYAGGIAGRNNSDGTITNCYNTGSVSATSSFGSFYARAGGIAGINGKTITNCYNTGEVSAYASISSDAHAGGIVGSNSATIKKCYNTGSVSADASGGSSSDASAGGIAGDNGYGAPITNCYNTGNVSASSSKASAYAGGIAGHSSYYAAITNCYYINNISQGVAYGTDKTTKCTEDELKKQETFVGFDFETVWTMESNTTYPYPVLKDVEMIWALNYTIDGDYIFGISAGTKVVQLIYGITEGEYRKVYKDGVELSYNELAGTGMTVKIFEGETVIATYTLVISGDINGDGKIDSTDYLLIKRAAFGTFTLTEAMKLAGDINSDNLIDSVDYLLIKRICFGTYKI